MKQRSLQANAAVGTGRAGGCRPRAGRQQGFSLLEILVAFSIMALALGTLYQSVGNSVRTVQRLDTHARVATLVRSVLALYPHVPPTGVADGDTTPDGYSWQASSAPHPVPELGNAPGARVLHRLVVDIRWDEAGRVGHYSVATLVPEAAQ